MKNKIQTQKMQEEVEEEVVDEDVEQEEIKVSIYALPSLIISDKKFKFLNFIVLKFHIHTKSVCI